MDFEVPAIVNDLMDWDGGMPLGERRQNRQRAHRDWQAIAQHCGASRMFDMSSWIEITATVIVARLDFASKIDTETSSDVSDIAILRMVPIGNKLVDPPL